MHRKQVMSHQNRSGLVWALVSAAKDAPNLNLTSRLTAPLSMYGLSNKRVSKYISLSLFIALAVSFILTLGLWIVSLKLDFAGFYPLTFLSSFSIVFIWLLLLPSFEHRKTIRQIEFELPFVSRILGAFLESGVPFNKSFERAISFSDVLKKELGFMDTHVLSIRSSLMSFYRRYNTPVIQRFTAYVLSVYESGSSGNKLTNLSDDLFSVVRSRLSDNSSKLSLLSMVFVALLVLLPTFMLIISSVLSFPLLSDQSGVFLLFFFLIPSVAMILVLFSKTFTIKKVRLPYTVFSVIYFVGLLSYLFVHSRTIQAVVVLVSVAVVFFTFRKKYAEIRRLEKIDSLIPDGLMTLESINHGVFKTLSESNLGVLTTEAKRSYTQIRSHVPERKALYDFYSRNPTKNVGVFCKVIETAYDLGSMRHVYGIAESIFKNEEISRYAQQLNSMQKYTLILGVFLLPLLLSVSSNVVKAMSDIGGSVHGVDVTSLLVPYMLVYNLLSAMYISQVSGKESEFYTNLVLFSVVSILVIFVFS